MMEEERGWGFFDEDARPPDQSICWTGCVASSERRGLGWDAYKLFFGWFRKGICRGKNRIENTADVESIESKSFLVCVGYNLCKGRA
jgi:hypothetical protein